MRNLILKALRESVKAYPELKGYLSDSALIMAHEVKIGEAPDDEQRLKDERKLKRGMINFFEGQYKRVIKEVKKDFSKSVYQPAFWSEEEMRMWEEVGGIFIDVVLHGVEGAIDLLPDGGQDILNITAIQNRIISRGMEYRNQWIKTINETTMKRIWDRINTWRETGDPIDELYKILEKDKSIFDKVRAKRIAITETTRLNALGHQMTYEETGYIKQFKWQTANDELVCPICRPNNGKLFPVSQLHELIPAHPNCRCWDTPVVDVEAFGETLDFTPEPGEWY